MNIRSRELQKINAFSMKGIILFEKIQSELQRAPVRFSSHVPSVYLKQRFPNSVVRVSAYYGAFRIVLICWQIQIARAVSYRLVSSAATELGSKMVARCSVFVQCFQATLCCCPGRATPRLSARLRIHDLDPLYFLASHSAPTMQRVIDASPCGHLTFSLAGRSRARVSATRFGNGVTRPV